MPETAQDGSQKTRLPPSKLGTKEHWDDVYKQEVQNFHDIQDEGEVWFPETVDKVVNWVSKHIPMSATVLEIGSGNGALLFELAEEGFPERHLYGVDYSEDAVTLAQAISESRDMPDIRFSVCDFLKEDPPLLEGHTDYDLVLDKGTFDAMALLEVSDSSVDAQEIYPAKISRLLSPGGTFLITSCNFTEPELISIFSSEEISHSTTIPHQSFSFGGRTGSTYTSVAFRKNQ